MVDVKLPDVPVIVNGVEDEGATLLAVRVRTLLPAVGLAPHVAVKPLGNAEVTARLTFPVKPPASVTLRVVEFEPPGFTQTVAGDPKSQKPGACGPAKSSIRFCPFALPHPVTRS